MATLTPAGPRSSVDRAADFESARGGSIPPGATPSPATHIRRPLLVYDGDCAFCTASAGWIAARWSGAECAVAWQDLGAEALDGLGIGAGEARRAAWWIDGAGRRSRGHLAIARALQSADGPLAVIGTVILVPPFRWLAAGGYRLVARRRHRLPGGAPACRS